MAGSLEGWEKYERDMIKRPAFSALKFFLVIVGLVTVAAVADYWFGLFGETAQVAQEQLGPRAVLKKYEWFRGAAALLEAKQANIAVYQKRQESMNASYAGKSRSEWAREDREQFNTWTSEVAGAVASYNNLAAEYNAAMAMVNWRFANVGDLPPGAERPLPREFKPYVVQ